MRRIFPITQWLGTYSKDHGISDATAAVIVTIMLVPQSLAYAMLAGLPPQVGLYASIAPLLVYTVLGTSMTLAIGPVAVTSLMTAAAIGTLADQGSAAYLAGAILLALVSGAMLLLMGLAKLGFLANFLSHPVISGFITASAVIIAAGQLKHLLGIDLHGHTLIEQAQSLAAHVGDTNWKTLTVGAAVLVFLVWSRRSIAPLMHKLGLSAKAANHLSKTAPVIAVIGSSLWVALMGWDAAGVAIVGDIPAGLPSLQWPGFTWDLVQPLIIPALVISIVGYVETISVAQTLAAKRRERIDPDQELIALGTANIGAALSGGFPVTGGFSRSVVNFDAGARTPMAGAMTAVGIALATLFLTPYLYFLPKATLAATIIVAVVSLVDLGALRRTWLYSKADFAAMSATIAITLAAGVEAGILAGVATSLFLHLKRTASPHIAEVGRVGDSEHFRNVLRHEVKTHDHILSLRVDESLYFPNARFLEDDIAARVSERDGLRHVVLICSAINHIDASALESLELLRDRLFAAGITLHLSEVKGPVMDRLQRTDFLDHLTGTVFLSHDQAIRALTPTRPRSPQNPDLKSAA